MDKNIIFYSGFDPYSAETLKLLSLNPSISKQFIKVCVHDPRNENPNQLTPNPHIRSLPSIVSKHLDKLPMLFIHGIKSEKPTRVREGTVAAITELLRRQGGQVPSGTQASSMNNHVKNDESGSKEPYGFEAVPDDTVSSCMTLDEMDQSATGIVTRDGRGEVGQPYANIHEKTQINTQPEERMNKSNQINARYEALKQDMQSMNRGRQGTPMSSPSNVPNQQPTQSPFHQTSNQQMSTYQMNQIGRGPTMGTSMRFPIMSGR